MNLKFHFVSFLYNLGHRLLMLNKYRCVLKDGAKLLFLTFSPIISIMNPFVDDLIHSLPI